MSIDQNKPQELTESRETKVYTGRSGKLTRENKLHSEFTEAEPHELKGAKNLKAAEGWNEGRVDRVLRDDTGIIAGGRS